MSWKAGYGKGQRSRSIRGQNNLRVNIDVMHMEKLIKVKVKVKVN
jgi:hypothetical protein